MTFKIKNTGDNVFYAVDDKHSLDAVNILYEGEITPTHAHSFTADGITGEILVEITGDMPKRFKQVVLKVQDIYFVYDAQKLFKGKHIANRIKLVDLTTKRLEEHFGAKAAQEVQNEAYRFAKHFSKQIMSGQLLLA